MNEYIEFLQPVATRIDLSKAQCWADLGCGSGVFTEALAGCLAEGSRIVGVDNRDLALPAEFGNGVAVNFLKADFERDVLDLPLLDGVLMANALHFVRGKDGLIKKLEKLFVAAPRFIIVEYETAHANQWVPFPIRFVDLKGLFGRHGYRNTKQIATRRSVYGGEMYLAIIHR